MTTNELVNKLAHADEIIASVQREIPRSDLLRPAFLNIREQLGLVIRELERDAKEDS